MSSNIPQMKVNNAVTKLSTCYETIIANKQSIKDMPSVMLWGPPGVGKSQLVRQIAKSLEDSTSKKVVVTDVRLLLFNPVDLRGIPTSNADKTLSIWLKPKIFDMDPSNKVINILFLDEISAAPQSVQAAAYQITLDRVVGEHRLPDNCIVIAAGNRVTDRSVAFKMPRALANRLLHIEIVPDFSSWRDWAIKNGINDRVLGFLSFKSDYLNVDDAKSDDVAFPTPRSWEMVSNILNKVSDDIEFSYQLISGLVGSGVASEFKAWSKMYKDLPKIEDIFLGRVAVVPKATDQLYALTSSMIAYARENTDNLKLIGNSIDYALKMPADFSCVLMKGYQSISKEFAKKLLTIPAYLKWMNHRGKLLNGAL
ncbi:MAG: AAA family ATPase [Clostridia bacterium]|nr:AAA family ATPase [Clostridia bacterium]